MTMPGEIRGREYDKFEEIGGLTHVRTTAKGTFVFSGLSKEIKITTVNVLDTPGKLPATALTGRNSLTIANLSDVDSIYIGNSDVEANQDIGTTAGLKIEPKSFWNIDITNSVELFAIAETGKTVKIQIVEVA